SSDVCSSDLSLALFRGFGCGVDIASCFRLSLAVARRIRLGGAFFRRGGGSILLTGTILGRSGLGTAGVGRRFLLRIVLRRRGVFTALVFSGSGLRQRRGIVRKRPQIGDYIG